MRSLTGILLAGAALFLLVIVVLPVVGFLLVALVALVAIAAGAYFAAPLLARLPWFRDRIVVEQHGRSRTVRFGRTQFTSYRPGGAAPGGRRYAGDVIDVEGRAVDDDEPLSPDLLPPPERRN